ncbi:helix-turn-helix transcriptional regulator [Mycobacterium paraterrae]|uniref:Helix-turn-helix domain-containing protein n=1 Tax=Mycobacterium paraterrae TaxID=577492 RepID=A0ABY3VNR7_9MYCO|nr:helix-turn-helix domain-containing protein [Mycobacterium paraterrae]UMB70103.1 helix-turn-helix domain-containing protein [Mycobacterium paraterrae]
MQPDRVIDDEFLATATVSKITGVPVTTLRYWRHAGGGPASFTLGRRVVYRRSEIERWIAEQEEATRRGGNGAA